MRLLVALLLPSVPVAEDLSCAGYRYNGIDWDHVRSKLEIYADKYLDRPQQLADVFQLSSEYALEYHPDNLCLLGSLSLRFFFWLRLELAELQASVLALAQRPPETTFEQIIQETYGWFWDLKLSWSEIMRSGWPLFSIIATVAGRLVDARQDPCVPADRLQLYVDSFSNAVYVPQSVDARTLLEAGQCPDAAASALVSLADNQRSFQPTQRNRYHSFSSTSMDMQPPDDDADALLASAESLLRKDRGYRLLTSQWPVWRLLDRLAASEVVNVSSHGAWFWMHVFPHRVRSDGLISNRIRATRQAYCFELFQEEALRLAKELHRPLRLVEAGPHIGDCMLWAAAVLGPDTRLMAVEPVPQVVSLFRKSIAANAFKIELHHGFLGAESIPSEGAATPWLKLDALLMEDIDILKIHTNGGERSILDGAARLFAQHKVRVVIVHSSEPEQLWGAAAFLLERQYRVRTEGRTVAQADEQWLKETVASRGGMQLHALAAT